MADSYEINGVILTPQGGGWYSISHPSLPDPVREQGKEAAEARAQIIAAGLAAMSTATVVAEGDGADFAPPIPGGASAEFRRTLDPSVKAALPYRMIDIILEENPEIPPTGLFIQHNYRPYVIVPGTPVSVPEFLVDVLDAAVAASAVTDPTTGRVLTYRDRMRYPYRRL